MGLACLSIAAFFLRLIYTNGLVAKTEVKAAYKPLSLKALAEFPQVVERVSLEVGKKKDQFRISLQTKVDNPLVTMESFNRQFQINKKEQEAVEWGWSREGGDTMFKIVNAYTRGSQFEGLSVESAYRLQRTGGMILEMVK